MGEALEHIEAWLAAGLIDEATAARLRAAEASGPEVGAVGRAAPGSTAPRTSSALADFGGASSAFGPAVSIGELFGYLGGIFLLGAWAAFVDQVGDGSESSYGLGAAVAALGAAVGGLALRRGDARRSRAAGVCFLVSTVLAAGAGLELARSLDIADAMAFVVAGVLGVAAGGVFRWVHPSLLTQVALLAGLTLLATAGLQWISDTFARPAGWDDYGVFRPRSGPDPLLQVIGQAAWWMVWALAIGYLGLLEDRGVAGSGDGPARRRAALTRFWAGVVAVLGLTVAVRLEDGASAYLLARVVPAWLGDLVILLLCALLIERAFRRGATGFLWAAALGIVIALTDLNVTYVTGNTWVVLLIEGAILLAVGYSAERLRRVVRGRRPVDGTPA